MPNLATISPSVSRHGREIREISTNRVVLSLIGLRSLFEINEFAAVSKNWPRCGHNSLQPTTTHPTTSILGKSLVNTKQI